MVSRWRSQYTAALFLRVLHTQKLSSSVAACACVAEYDGGDAAQAGQAADGHQRQEHPQHSGIRRHHSPPGKHHRSYWPMQILTELCPAPTQCLQSRGPCSHARLATYASPQGPPSLSGLGRPSAGPQDSDGDSSSDESSTSGMDEAMTLSPPRPSLVPPSPRPFLGAAPPSAASTTSTPRPPVPPLRASVSHTML